MIILIIAAVVLYAILYKTFGLHLRVGDRVVTPFHGLGTVHGFKNFGLVCAVDHDLPSKSLHYCQDNPPITPLKTRTGYFYAPQDLKKVNQQQ